MNFLNDYCYSNPGEKIPVEVFAETHDCVSEIWFRRLCRPLHLCTATANVAVVKKWVEIATKEQIETAIEVVSSVGTALVMAAALKKAHGEGGNMLYNHTHSSR